MTPTRPPRTVTGDTVIEQTLNTYDTATGNLWLTRHFQRWDTATGTGPLHSPSEDTQPKARVTYSVAWFDPARPHHQDRLLRDQRRRRHRRPGRRLHPGQARRYVTASPQPYSAGGPPVNFSNSTS